MMEALHQQVRQFQRFVEGEGRDVHDRADEEEDSHGSHQCFTNPNRLPCFHLVPLQGDRCAQQSLSTHGNQSTCQRRGSRGTYSVQGGDTGGAGHQRGDGDDVSDMEFGAGNGVGLER